jgi:hypothetical protein
MKKMVYWVVFSIMLSACVPSATQTANTPSPKLAASITPTPTLPATNPPSPTLPPTKPPSPAPTATPSEIIYTSCADPDLLDKVSSDFQEKTGLSVKEALEYLSESGKIKPGADTTDKPSLFHYEAMYLGDQTISLAHLPDAQEGDQMMCTFVALPSQVAPDGAIDVLPLMAGYVYQGMYYRLASLVDVAEKDMDIFQDTPETQIDDVATWLDQHMIPGSHFELLIETFYGVKGVEDVGSTENISMLLSLLDNGYLERMIAVNSTSPHDVKEALNPNMGDLGMMAVFQAVVDKDVLP